MIANVVDDGTAP